MTRCLNSEFYNQMLKHYPLSAPCMLGCSGQCNKHCADKSTRITYETSGSFSNQVSDVFSLSLSEPLLCVFYSNLRNTNGNFGQGDSE